MTDFLCIALLAGIFLMLAIIADVLSRIHAILDCLDDDDDEDYYDDEDDDWPEPDPNH